MCVCVCVCVVSAHAFYVCACVFRVGVRKKESVWAERERNVISARAALESEATENNNRRSVGLRAKQWQGPSKTLRWPLLNTHTHTHTHTLIGTLWHAFTHSIIPPIFRFQLICACRCVFQLVMFGLGLANYHLREYHWIIWPVYSVQQVCRG